jgi:hypothetical protein
MSINVVRLSLLQVMLTPPQSLKCHISVTFIDQWLRKNFCVDLGKAKNIKLRDCQTVCRNTANSVE